MNKPHPAVFQPDLESSRLEMVAKWLLEELYATEDDLTRSTDNGYTRGCTAFMRQRNRIIAENITGKHPWLGVPNTGNDLVFTIGKVPCRFSNDDPMNPTKDAVLIASRYQESFVEFAAKDEAARFCFVVDRGQAGNADPRVELLGFNPSGALVCRWVSDNVRVLRLVDSEQTQPLAQPVPVAKPTVAPKRRTGTSDNASTDEGGDGTRDAGGDAAAAV